MKKYKISFKKKKVHFIGIGGIGMSALAKHLSKNGYSVSGSDINLSAVKDLRNLGIEVFANHSPNNIKNSDLVVYSSAINENNDELSYASENKILLLKRSQLLNEIMSKYKRSIAISGSHGKTTATAMLANVLLQARLEPTVFLGGEDKGFGNYYGGNGQIVLAEACEYKRNFLDLKSKITVILNIDNDHLDCYQNMQDLIGAFAEFSKGSVSIINADDQNAKQIFNEKTITFGINSSATIMAKYLKKNFDGYSFSAYAFGKKLGRVNLKISGKHNVYNALSTIAVSEYLKIPFKVQKQALESFSGVKRRNEFLGRAFDMDIFADYAHHPREISAMLNLYAESGEQPLIFFQPHTYSRTKILMKEFIKCFENDYPLIIMKTFPARERYFKEGSARTLYEQLKIEGKKVFYVKDKQGVEKILESYKGEYKKALFLGAGDIYDLIKKIIEQKINKQNEKK